MCPFWTELSWSRDESNWNENQRHRYLKSPLTLGKMRDHMPALSQLQNNLMIAKEFLHHLSGYTVRQLEASSEAKWMIEHRINTSKSERRSELEKVPVATGNEGGARGRNRPFPEPQPITTGWKPLSRDNKRELLVTRTPTIAWKICSLQKGQGMSGMWGLRVQFVIR